MSFDRCKKGQTHWGGSKWVQKCDLFYRCTCRVELDDYRNVHNYVLISQIRFKITSYLAVVGPIYTSMIRKGPKIVPWSIWTDPKPLRWLWIGPKLLFLSDKGPIWTLIRTKRSKIAFLWLPKGPHSMFIWLMSVQTRLGSVPTIQRLCLSGYKKGPH